jgi:hypothetical protein
VPTTAIQTWSDFASAIVDERDPQKITDLITQLNHDLADIDSRPRAAVIAVNGSES